MNKIEMQRIEQTLEMEAEKFLKEAFDLELSIPIVISGRMKRSLGLFRSIGIGEYRAPVDIRISKNMIEYYEWHEVLDTLKHECIHYALFRLGKPFNDGHPYFEQTLKLFGVSSTGSKRYKGVGYKYKCEGCGREIKTRLKGYEKKYISRCCKKEFTYKGETMIGVEEEEKQGAL